MLARLTSSLEQQVGVECLDFIIQMLEQKNMTSTLTSRPDYTNQLARCVLTACTDSEQQLQVCRYIVLKSLCLHHFMSLFYVHSFARRLPNL